MTNRIFTILVAEDEDSSRYLYQEELSEEGYKVLAVQNGLQVLGTLEDQPVDLLLTDIQMPDMNATELIPRVRAEHPSLPIIIVSAYKGLGEELQAGGHRLDGFFLKPADMGEIKKRIREVLQKQV